MLIATAAFSPDEKPSDGLGYANGYAFANGQAPGLSERMQRMAAAAADGIVDGVDDGQ